MRRVPSLVLALAGVCGLALTANVGLAGGAKKAAVTPETAKIEFIGTKPNGKHDGGFNKFKGSVTLPDGGLKGAAIRVEIDTTSLHADNPKLTKHLKSKDFFDVAKNPAATFVSTAVEPKKAGGSTHVVTGDLTLCGVKKQIAFPARVSVDGGRLNLQGRFTINREDFGMVYGRNQIDNAVTLIVSVRAPIQ